MITRCTHGGPCGVVSLRSIFRATMEQRSPRVAFKLKQESNLQWITHTRPSRLSEGKSAGFYTDFTVLFTQFCAQSRSTGQ